MREMVLKTDMLNMQVYNLLKKEILQHRIPQGERLVDSQLADRFGISLTPVRDAIFMLVREGLVENKGKRGFYVLEVGARDIDELYDIRVILETQGVRQVVEKCMKADPDGCREKILEIRRNTNEYVGEDCIKADEYFHDSLIRLLGNRRIDRIFADIRNQMRVFLQMTSQIDERVQNGVWYHNQILDAVLAMDADRAEQLMRDHIEKGRREAHEDAL